MTAPGILRLSAFLLIATCLANCESQDTSNSNAQPVIKASESVAADSAVTYANRVTDSPPYYHEGYFEHEGMRLHYVEAGKGDLVILYHGFPSFWFSFFDQMEALKSGYRVVAIDGLGAGLSDKPDALSAYTVEALAAQLDAFAHHLADDEKFILIGHDWGAALSLSFAEAYPDRLKAVVGMSAPSYNVFLDLFRSSEKQRATSAYMQRFRETSPDAVRQDPPGERLWRMSYGKLVERGDLSEEENALFREALAPAAATNGGYNWYRANAPDPTSISVDDYWPNPPSKIRVPALLIHGGDDRIFIPAYINKMKQVADELKVVILPGINHWTPMQSAEQSTQAIQDFLADD